MLAASKSECSEETLRLLYDATDAERRFLGYNHTRPARYGDLVLKSGGV